MGDRVRFKLDYDANFPLGIRFEVDGEERNVIGHHDSSTAVVEYQFPDAGDHKVWMAIVAIEDYTLAMSPFEPNEVTTMIADEATWNVFCMERDELYTTPAEEIKEFITDLLMLYSIGSISKWALVQVYETLKRRDERTKADRENERAPGGDVAIEDDTEGNRGTERETRIGEEIEESESARNDENVTALPEFQTLAETIESEHDGSESQ